MCRRSTKAKAARRVHALWENKPKDVQTSKFSTGEQDYTHTSIGLRFTFEMATDPVCFVEWMAPTKQACDAWVNLLARHGVTARVAGAFAVPTLPGALSSVQVGDPQLYKPVKSKTSTYTLKPVIGLQLVDHVTRGVVVSAITGMGMCCVQYIPPITYFRRRSY